MTIFGWDGSNFDLNRDADGMINMRAIAADGITFVTHKATEGTRTIHLNFRQVMNDAREAGIKYLGAYMVPRTPGNGGNGSISAQVDYFLGYVIGSVPWWRDFPGWFWQVDTEHWSNQNGVYDAVSPATGVEACRLLRERAPRQIFHYAPRWSYGDTIPGDEPLWASSYVTGSGPYRSLYPGDDSGRWVAYSGRRPSILQYSSHAIIGENATCDANAFSGTLAEWHELITGKDLDDMTPEQDERLKWLDGRIASIADGQDTYVDPAGRGHQNVLVAELHEIKGAIAALTARPPGVFTAEQVADLGAMIVDHPDTPLGPADQPAIVAAIDAYVRSRLGV